MGLKLKIHDSEYFAETILSLSCCPSLVQLGFITTSKFHLYNDEAEFTALFVDLVQRLPKLIALLVIIPGVSQSNCGFIDSRIQIPSYSPLFFVRNYLQSGQRQSTQVAIFPLQDACSQSASVGGWTVISSNSF